MTTIMKQAFEQKWIEVSSNSPEWAMTVSEYYSKLMRGYFNDVDWFGQYFERARLTMVDAYIFSILHSNVCVGKYTFCKIGVGCGPFSDKNKEYNNKALQKLPLPFSAKFYGGPGDSDGYLEWSDIIETDCIDVKGNRIVEAIR